MKEQNQKTNNMIQPSELRLGNWVQLDWDGKCANLPITGIIEDRVWFAEYDDFDISCIYPIPLTPDILEKCGFVFFNDQNKYGWYLVALNRLLCWCHSDFISLEFKQGECDNYDDTLFDISSKYLHQLQNLFFALCGEELNFKP